MTNHRFHALWTLPGPLVLLMLPALVHAHPATYLIVNLELSWGTNGNEKDCNLRIKLTGQYVSGPQTHTIKVDVIRTAGTPVTGGNDIVNLTLPTNSSGTIDQTRHFDVNYAYEPNGIDRVRVDIWENGATGEPTRTILQTVPDYCPNIANTAELNTLNGCGSCYSTQDLPAAAITIYKTIASPGSGLVYSLAEDDKTGATFGETVSGSFRAPKCGVLKVQVNGLDATDDRVRVFLEGWNGAGTTATSGTSYVRKLAKDELYRFSVRAVRGKHGPVTLLFDWYTWKDHVPPGSIEDCLMLFKFRPGGIEGLAFNIEEMIYKKVPVGPGELPRISGKRFQVVDGGQTNTWYELDIPACGPHEENMTERFILPISADAKINDGHAVGWRKAGGTMTAPDPDGVVYEVPGF